MEIIPAILAADRANFGQQWSRVVDLAPVVQIDFTDGSLTDNQTMTPADISVPPAGVRLQAHLMVKEPLQYLPAEKPYSNRFTDAVIVEAAALPDFTAPTIHHFLAWGQLLSARVGLSLPLGFDLDSIAEDVLSKFQLVQVMAVPEGKQGQPFDRRALELCRTLRAALPYISIQIDGGVNEQTIAQCAAVGATGVAVGHVLTEAADPVEMFRRMQVAATMRV